MTGGCSLCKRRRSSSPTARIAALLDARTVFVILLGWLEYLTTASNDCCLTNGAFLFRFSDSLLKLGGKLLVLLLGLVGDRQLLGDELPETTEKLLVDKLLLVRELHS